MTLPALGIDIGLSGTRAAVVSASGELLGRGRIPSRLWRNPACAEYRPQDWLEETIGAARIALGAAGCGAVEAIGVGALGPCPVLLDDDGEALGPAPLFSLDSRAEGHRQRLARERGLDQATMGPDHALPKLLWWQDNHPDLAAKARVVVDATGYIVARLAGRPVMDPITVGDYRVAGVELPVPTPEPLPADSIAGGLLPGPAKALGLPAGIPVAVGSYDSFVDVAGTGATSPGSACVILGSTMILGSIVAHSVASPELRCSLHIGPGFFLGGWTSSAGSLLDWSRDLLGAVGTETLDDLAPGAGGLLMLPYLAGERTPVWDPAARGLLLGLTLSTTRSEIHRAALDGVALSALDLGRRVKTAAGPIERWRLGGGGARSGPWAQAIADALDETLEIVAHAGEAVPPALLALRAAGHDAAPRIERRVVPNSARHRRYLALHAIYRELYPKLAESMHELGRLAAAKEGS